MTPKEKAIDLVNKFKKYNYWILHNDPLTIKQCAFITVNEILDCIYNEDFRGHLIDEINASDYWKEVEEELIKLEDSEYLNDERKNIETKR